MEIKILNPGLAAEISGIDLSKILDEDDFEPIREAWHSSPVLRFREQQISDDHLMAFSEHFGPLDHAPIGLLKPDQDLNDIPKVTVISNIIENEKPIGGLGATEAAWHTDISYTEEPAMASILHAIEIPNEGGNTHFCNMYASYQSLPNSLRTRLQGLKLKHDATHTSVGGLRRGFEEVSDPKQTPGAIHPIIRTHPETQRKALFLGRRYQAYVMGFSLDDSESLLDELWTYAARQEDCWAQEWQVNDVLLWDNRAVMHRRDEFDPNSRRLMHRTQIHGDRPVE